MPVKHCCYGTCTNDNRKADICLKEGIRFIQFPDPSIDKAKAERWVVACRRENFSITNITRWTYICNKHFLDPAGPTRLNPDPVPATTSNVRIETWRKRQRQPTKERPAVLNKSQKLEISETLLSLQDPLSANDDHFMMVDTDNYGSGAVDESTVNASTHTDIRMEILELNSNADKAILPCKRPRIDDGESKVVCQVVGVDSTDNHPVDLSHHKHCLVVEDDIGKENAFVDEKKKLRSLQDDLRNEETKLVLLRKIRSSQQNTRSRADATNGPKTATDPRTSGQQVLSHHHNGSANIKTSAPVKTGAPPVTLPVPSRTLLQPSSQQTHLVTPGSRGVDTRVREGIESRSFPGSHLKQAQHHPPQLHSKLSLTPHQKERLAAQRQLAAKQALRKQLERTLLQIPPPKPPKPMMSLVPNASSAEFVVLLGLEEAVKAIVRLDVQARAPASDDSGAKAPFLCCQCGTDFTPLWKLDKRDPLNVVCKHCVASNRKRALKQQHTNCLKTAFVKALQQEKEMEKCLQSLEAQHDGVAGPSKSYTKAVISSGRIQLADPDRQHAAILAAHQSRSRVSSFGAYPYDRSVVYHGKSLSSHHHYPLGSKDSRSHGTTLDGRGVPFTRT